MTGEGILCSLAGWGLLQHHKIPFSDVNESPSTFCGATCLSACCPFLAVCGVLGGQG